MSEITDIVSLAEVTCSSCGIRYGLPESLHALRRKDHRFFYCPNGHAQSYVRIPPTRDEELETAKAEATRLRRENAAHLDEKAALQAKVDQLEARRRPRRLRR